MTCNLDRVRNNGNFVLVLAFASVPLCHSGFLEICADCRLPGET